MDMALDGGSHPSNESAPPRFLAKTYDMVDDPSTDRIVSWSATNNSFVVWDHPEFARNLLPKYFKHNNFSSFVRQLNTYRFRKVDPDRWEFANEGFLRGQKHLLKGINRRKAGHVQTLPIGSCVEVGKFGLEEEIEWLKRDKNVLTQELVRLRQQQQSTESEMQVMVQRLQGMEQRQQQMMSFLAKAVNSPSFLAQLVQQQQNDNNNMNIGEANKKRRLKQEDGGVLEEGHMIRYQQPLVKDAAAEEASLFRQIMKHEEYAMSSPSSSSGSADYGGPRLSQQHLHDVLTGEFMSEAQSPTLGSISETILYPLVAGGGGGVEGLGLESVCVADNKGLDICMSSEALPVEMMSNICEEGEIELEDSLQKLPSIGDPFWEALLASGPIIPSDDTDSCSVARGEVGIEMNNRSSSSSGGQKKKMEQLTEQMGFLSSNTRRL